MKCIDWTDVRWAVVKEDGSFAGVPCASYGEARDLAQYALREWYQVDD